MRIIYRSSKLSLIGVLLVFGLMLYIQLSWIQSAYLVEQDRVKVMIRSVIRDRVSLIKQIEEMNRVAEYRELDDSTLYMEERQWRAFFDAQFSKLGVVLDDYDFAIQVQASISNEPTLFRLKSSHFDKTLSSPEYVHLQKIVFSDFKNNIFSYDGKLKAFRIILSYKIAPHWVLWRMWNILLGTFLTTVIAIIATVLWLMFQKKERRLRKMKLDFLNGITHELNTPIAVIQLATEFLKKKYDPHGKDEFFRDTTYAILQETRRMAMLVKSVLATARLEQEKMALKFESVDVVALLKSIIQVYQFHLSAIDHDVKTSFAAERVYVLVDPFHFHHALSNIVDNAIKYREKSRKLIFEVSVQQDEQNVTISCRDNGIGMSKEEEEKVFYRFFRGKEAPKQMHGFGVGLSYVLEVIELHKGKITLSSELGQGTTVVLVLPRANAS